MSSHQQPRLKTVLILGRKQTGSEHANIENFSAETVRDMLATQNQNAASRGFGLTPYLIDIDPAQEQQVLNDVETLLNSKKWDCICIGLGVRGNGDLTPLFEKLVNMSMEKEERPRMAFPTRPDGILEAVERVLGSN